MGTERRGRDGNREMGIERWEHREKKGAEMGSKRREIIGVIGIERWE